MHTVGGSPPFRYSVFTEPQGSKHRTEHALGTTTDNEVTWNVNVVAGTQVFFQVQSSDGGTIQLGGRFVKSSDDDTCLDDVPSPSSEPTFITSTIIRPTDVTSSSTSNSPPQTSDDPRTSFTTTRSDTETTAATHVSTFTTHDSSRNPSPSTSQAESPSAPRVSRSLDPSSAADSNPSSTSGEATILSTGSNPVVTVTSGSPLPPSSHSSKVGLVVGVITAVTITALLCIVYWSYLRRKRRIVEIKSQSSQITDTSRVSSTPGIEIADEQFHSLVPHTHTSGSAPPERPQLDSAFEVAVPPGVVNIIVAPAAQPSKNISCTHSGSAASEEKLEQQGTREPGPVPRTLPLPPSETSINHESAVHAPPSQGTGVENEATDGGAHFVYEMDGGVRLAGGPSDEYPHERESTEGFVFALPPPYQRYESSW
ncbi:hypothetical protein C8Q74DRAFT_1370512 [Fomes fomentarius]|nr:hypothetical protein C8Q74DRAFT_1370512 [Fomes fomentarius]